MKKLVYIIIPILIIIFTFFLINDNSNHIYYTEVNPNELNKLVKRKKTMVVFFKKDGCSHCEQVKPIINDFAKNNKTKIYSLTINKYKNMGKLANKYNISGTPVVAYYKKGKEKSRLLGGFTIKKFKKFISKQKVKSD